jgi:hypothetical protein
MANAARYAPRQASSSESRRDEPGAIGEGDAPLRAPNADLAAGAARAIPRVEDGYSTSVPNPRRDRSRKMTAPAARATAMYSSPAV